MIAEKVFSISEGGVRVFNSDFAIKGKTYVRMFLDILGDETFEIMSEELYDIINDNVVFEEAPVGVLMYMQVATVPSELTTSPTDVSIIVAMRDELNSLVADKVTLDSLYADKVTLDSLYADKETLDSIGASTENIDIVSENIAHVNNFHDTYHGAQTIAPDIISHPKLSEGDMYFDTTTKFVRTYDGESWSNSFTGDFYSKAETDQLNRTVPMKIKALEDILTLGVVTGSAYNQGEDAIEVTKTVSQSNIAIGIASSNIATGSFEDVITRGLIEGVDTSAWAFGTTLYSSGLGGLSATKPSGAYQAVGFVVKNHAVTGAIMVLIGEPVTPITLNDTMTSSSTTEASTANIAKTLKDTADTLAGNVLQKDNTTEFIPSADYHPTTKKYVDSAKFGAGADYTYDTSTREANIVYTSDADSMFFLSVIVSSNSGSALHLEVGGVKVDEAFEGSAITGYLRSALQALIPIGAEYEVVDVEGARVVSWKELRI